jgi:signal transduction histidine kinase/DNA-binding response OmpR family regulator
VTAEPAQVVHPRQRLVRERRQYNQWVASQTLEDFALRYTAGRARRSSFRVGNTALGPTAFLACEAIGGSITLAYGFHDAVWAIGSFAVLMFLIGLPIAYYAARYGVDIDLLTRGAGFGYMGSTITSLIYASFTFLLFSIEATIMSVALEMLFGIPLAAAYVLSSLVVIPIALYGITFISRMQLATQGVWLTLQFLPLAYVAMHGKAALAPWTAFRGLQGGAAGASAFMAFGMSVSMLLSLLPQIGEQVDYLRFLPQRRRENAVGWWSALLLSGPGWIVMGAFKLLAGSFLAVLALRYGVPALQATQPSTMYYLVYRETLGSPGLALALTGVFVIVCQLKINVTNAYAGSIAWSNFFSRLTHSHPGRVVWLVFNVVLALLLMEIGIFRVIDGALMIYANFAAGWIGALTADLVVNKPLGLSPPGIEFKRAHLYDVNPVGVGALLVSVLASSLSFLGLFGPGAQVLSPLVGLTIAFAAAPLIAWATGGRYYLARPPSGVAAEATLSCTVCENEFEGRDMAMCPAYSGPICSLCCTLEARCRDLCKTDSRFAEQLVLFVRRLLPPRLALSVGTRAGQFAGLLLLFNAAIGLLLAFIYHQYGEAAVAERAAVGTTLRVVFLCLLLLSGVAAWVIVLAHESRRTAERESARQTAMLMEEIEAHRRTDAALQKAKEVAEAANIAKTRYIVGMSHEIRAPLNSIFGYAQLLERGSRVAPENAARIIRRSSEHLSNLVDGLLDISRIENGLLRLNRDKVRLPEFLDQIVDMFRLQAASKGIGFRYHAPQNLPQLVHTDQKRLRQILINLLSNAIKYTEQGHAALTIRYRSEVAEFEVADTGFGIPAEDLERIFEPFERGRGAGALSQPGTGLGLTITRLLTQIMGGEVLVRSTPGQGTTFVVRLLLSQASQGVEETPTPQQPVVGYAGVPRRVLLADDDPVHQGLLTSLLEPLGFEVSVAGDGVTCLELASGRPPHLVVLDISMPDMTGWQVAERLRAAEASRHVKILVVSANAHEYMPGGHGGQLHDGFLVKPIDVAVFLESVGSLLDLEWLREPQPRKPQSAAGECTAAPGSERHLQDLYELGRIGHVRGIGAKLDQLEAESPANGALAAHLRGLVASFDLKRYMSVLEGLRRQG